MLKIALLDDEKECLELIKTITCKYMRCKGIEYELREYTRTQDLLYDLEEKEHFDIYLLDVELPESSGLQAARKIREKYLDSFIIYITNYTEYAIEAFEVNAYRYIPKSCLKEKLTEAYKALYDQILQREEKFYTIVKTHQVEKIPYHEIYYLTKEGKYVVLTHKRGESRVRKTLETVMDELSNRKQFIYTDKSFVVNMIHIMSLEDNQIILRNNAVVPVSRPRLEQVKRDIMEYWR